jgi:hypothetical protein
LLVTRAIEPLTPPASLSGLRVGRPCRRSCCRHGNFSGHRGSLRFETFDASLTKSVACKFRGDTRVERLRRREIGAAAFRIILTPQAGETAAIK